MGRKDQLPTFFRKLNREQQELLQPLFKQVNNSAGSTLFEQGDKAKHLFLVIGGEVIIRFKPDDGPAILVTSVKKGGIVGWSAALGNRNYTSCALCKSDTQLLRVSGKSLRNLCNQNPDMGFLILESLANVIASRLNSAHHEVIELLKLGMKNSLNDSEDN